MKIYSPLLIPDALVSGSQLIVSGTLDVTQDITGKSNLQINQDGNFDGKLTVQGDITGSSNLRIEGDTVLVGRVTLKGGVDGEIIIGDAGDIDDISVGGKFITDLLPKDTNQHDLGRQDLRWAEVFAQNLDIEEDVRVGGDLSVEGDITGSQNLQITQDGNFDGNLTVQQNITGSQNLQIDGNGTFDGTLDVGQDITGSQNLQIDGNGTIDGTLDVGQDITGSQNLQIDGNGNFGGNLVVDQEIFVNEITNIKDLGKVDTVYYVSPNGNDDNNGRTLENAVRTIKKAVELATTQIEEAYQGPAENNPIHFNTQLRISIQVKSGNYEEVTPIRVPAFVSILGDDLRTTLVQPTQQTSTENLFQVNNGCYFSGLRLTGCEVDDLEDPRQGFFFAFDPGAFITTSPYVQNCSAIDTPVEEFFLPIDPKVNPDGSPDLPTDPEEEYTPNPALRKGPGGMLVDDSVLDPYSPLRSMVLDAYTQVAFNGIGFCARGRGFCQLVSFFTNFSRVGVYCIDGGHAALLNSNTSFGDYGLRSRGFRILVEPDVSGVSEDVFESASTTLLANSEQIIDHLINNFQSRGDLVGDYNDPVIEAATRKDAGILVQSIAQDLTTKKASLISRFTQGLFLGQDITEGSTRTLSNGVIVAFNPSLTPDFIESYNVIQSFIESSILSGDPALPKIEQILDVPRNTLDVAIIQQTPVNDTPILRLFGSLLTTTAHDFSFAGSGVNYQGLPSAQGGVGRTNRDIRVFKEQGGRVFVNGGDETGDFLIGDDLAIRQATGTIEGRTFARSLFALVTPFFLALEQID